MYHGTLLTTDCSLPIMTESTDTQKLDLRQSWPDATRAFPRWNVSYILHRSAPPSSTNTFPGLQIVSCLRIVAEPDRVSSTKEAVTTSRQSIIPVLSSDRKFPFPLRRSAAGNPGGVEIRSVPETFASAEASTSCKIHPVRPRRRRGIHEKRNADQRSSTRRKSHCDC